MIRGVDGRQLFAGDSTREDFLARFGLLVRELGFVVLAWCLLGNHAHFVLKTGRAPLALLMARLNSRHAQRLNRKINRVGHLFQDRYKAVLVTTDGWLARDVAYALGNPVRHGLMSMRRLETYRYSGYGALAGTLPPRSFESPPAVAKALGVARENIRSFIHERALEPGARSAALEPDQVAELDLLIRDCCRRHGVEELSLGAASSRGQATRGEIFLRAESSLDLALIDVARRVGTSYRTAKRIIARQRSQ